MCTRAGVFVRSANTTCGPQAEYLQPAASCRCCQHVQRGPHLTPELIVEANTHIMNSTEPRASSHDESSGNSSAIPQSCRFVMESSDRCTDAPAQRHLCAACGAAAACSRCSSPAAGSCKQLTGRCGLVTWPVLSNNGSCTLVHASIAVQLSLCLAACGPALPTEQRRHSYQALICPSLLPFQPSPPGGPVFAGRQGGTL
jgi:hypothetical protein